MTWLRILACPGCGGTIVSLISGLALWHEKPLCGIRPHPRFRTRTGEPKKH